MIRKQLLVRFGLCCALGTRAQVGINNPSPDASAELDVTSTNRGFLAPRMNTAQMNAITVPAAGLAVYNTDSSTYCIYTGTSWLRLLPSSSKEWMRDGTAMYNQNGGKVGIGTATPTEALDVNGRTKTSNLQLTNGAANSYLLQSDDSGNATWTSINNIIKDTNTKSSSTQACAANFESPYSIINYTTGNGTFSEDTYLAVTVSATSSSTVASENGYYYFELTSPSGQTIEMAVGYPNVSGATFSTAGTTAAPGIFSLTVPFTGSYNIIGPTGPAISTLYGSPMNGNWKLNLRYMTGGNGAASACITGWSLAICESNPFGDNLGSHTAGRNVRLNGYYLSNDGGNEGIRVTDAGYVGIGTATAVSTLDVSGTVGLATKNAQVAGSNSVDATGSVWICTSGSGSISLPSASASKNRIYTILNQTGAVRSISSYKDLSGSVQSTLAASTALWIVSDGTNWQQIK
ncbi:hypothetical protein [Flaviaesturariibacter amylovorans]|uniref:P/Homo B domain-containing protein n=1 Tax=Flaviaesturariibacter amylovorans TaxID=1084520 RepID=A0ABP8GW23_9BACT